MRSRLRFALAFASLSSALGLLLPAVARGADAEVNLAVIVAASSKLSEMSLSELRQTYLSERVSDPGGNKLIPLNHPPKTVDRAGFDRVVLNMSPDEVGRFWVDRRIRGGNGPPRTVESLATLRRIVQNLPGALGYLRPPQLSGDLKMVRIDGKLPGEPGYPVRFRE